MPCKERTAFAVRSLAVSLYCCWEAGKTYCPMGLSGMGKATLFRILMGPGKPGAGRIDGLGENDVTATFQEDRLFMWLSPGENAAIMYKTRPG